MKPFQLLIKPAGPDCDPRRAYRFYLRTAIQASRFGAGAFLASLVLWGCSPRGPGSAPTTASPGSDDSVYIAFHATDQEDLENLLEMTGGPGRPRGRHRLAVSAHLNPLGNNYTKGPPDFRVDGEKVREKLAFLAASGLPVYVGIFAGKFFTSEATEHLQKTETNLMWDQFGEPIRPGERRGGTYFAISPGLATLPPNEFLKLYERNLREIARIVAGWARDNPGRLVGVSFAGETKYPPAKRKEKGAGPLWRWADYGPFAIARFRDYAREQAGGGWQGFLIRMGMPEGTFSGFSDLDPPRGSGRGPWDTLDDPSHPYFAFWNEFRVEEVKHHIAETVRWGREEGIGESGTARIYSHQAIWDQDSMNHYWRGAPVETLMIPGIDPGVSLYGDKTGDAGFISRVGAISGPSPGRWATLQYNPDGPPGSDDGYPVEEYLRRLKLLEAAGVRVIGVYNWGAGPEDKHFVRNNFLEAVRRFLAEET